MGITPLGEMADTPPCGISPEVSTSGTCRAVPSFFCTSFAKSDRPIAVRLRVGRDPRSRLLEPARRGSSKPALSRMACRSSRSAHPTLAGSQMSAPGAMSRNNRKHCLAVLFMLCSFRTSAAIPSKLRGVLTATGAMGVPSGQPSCFGSPFSKFFCAPFVLR